MTARSWLLSALELTTGTGRVVLNIHLACIDVYTRSVQVSRRSPPPRSQRCIDDPAHDRRDYRLTVPSRRSTNMRAAAIGAKTSNHRKLRWVSTTTAPMSPAVAPGIATAARNHASLRSASPGRERRPQAPETKPRLRLVQALPALAILRQPVAS